MDPIRKLLGLIDDDRRVYVYEVGEVEREEFQHSQLLYNYLFDQEKGVIATLGPTWNLVHDPRFLKIENRFIRTRKKMFSPGSTLLGRETVTGAFAGFALDLQQMEQYATIIGEGRHFRDVIAAGGVLDEDNDPCHPKTFYQEPGSVIWKAIHQECPNWFTKEGKPNREAATLYDLLREDLVGLIDDYAEVPLMDEFINSETGEVYEEDKWDGETPVIYVEVDLLEKALTVRGNLRIIAAKVLDRLGFSKYVSGGERLTDIETDELLRIVYTSNWPDDRLELVQKIVTFVIAKNAAPFAERQAKQLALASGQSKELIAKIKSGEIKQFNRHTDPADETSMDPQAAITKSIQDNPFKRDLFMIYTDAERGGDQATIDLLKPVFEDANYVVSEQVFQSLIGQIRYSEPPLAVITAEGECHARVPRYWNADIGAFTELCRKPRPCPEHSEVGTGQIPQGGTICP